MANALLDFLQGASNAAASNVSAPVDGLAWLLRKAGINVGDAPVGGADWMRQRGLTAEPTNKRAGLLGESVGGVAPMLVAAKAPQIAQGLLQMGENAAIPSTMNRQAGMIRTPFGRIPENHQDTEKLAAMLDRAGTNAGYTVTKSGSALSPSKYVSFSNGLDGDLEKTLQVRLSNHADKYPELAQGVRTSVDPSTEQTFEQAVNWLGSNGFPTSLSKRYGHIPSIEKAIADAAALRESYPKRLQQLQSAWIGKPKATRGAPPTMDDVIRIYGQK